MLPPVQAKDPLSTDSESPIYRVAMFALGYYLEVGIGPGGVDIPRSIEWYRKAKEGGNSDTEERLRVLEGDVCL